MPRATLLTSWLVAVVTAAVAAGPSFAPLPKVPQAVQDSAPRDAAAFLRLWSSVLSKGSHVGPVIRLNFEATTILAPSNFHMMNMVPQHVRNPLLAPNFTQLKREFLMDHILLYGLDLSAESLNSTQGLSMETYSGKTVVFRRDLAGDLEVDGIPILRNSLLPDGTRLLTVDGVLLGARERVNLAYGGADAVAYRNSLLLEPLGPPLDLGPTFSGVGEAPAPPTREDLARVAHIQPNPAAYPPGFVYDPVNALPPSGPVEGVVGDLPLQATHDVSPEPEKVTPSSFSIRLDFDAKPVPFNEKSLGFEAHSIRNDDGLKEVVSSPDIPIRKVEAELAPVGPPGTRV